MMKNFRFVRLFMPRKDSPRLSPTVSVTPCQASKPFDPCSTNERTVSHIFVSLHNVSHLISEGTSVAHSPEVYPVLFAILPCVRK